MFDNASYSPFFNYKDSKGALHQLWFDDPVSLAGKYALARQAGAGGVGAFQVAIIMIVLLK